MTENNTPTPLLINILPFGFENPKQILPHLPTYGACVRYQIDGSLKESILTYVLINDIDAAETTINQSKSSADLIIYVTTPEITAAHTTAFKNLLVYVTDGVFEGLIKLNHLITSSAFTKSIVGIDFNDLLPILKQKGKIIINSSADYLPSTAIQKCIDGIKEQITPVTKIKSALAGYFSPDPRQVHFERFRDSLQMLIEDHGDTDIPWLVSVPMVQESGFVVMVITYH